MEEVSTWVDTTIAQSMIADPEGLPIVMRVTSDSSRAVEQGETGRL